MFYKMIRVAKDHFLLKHVISIPAVRLPEFPRRVRKTPELGKCAKGHCPDTGNPLCEAKDVGQPERPERHP